ncbi:MAG: hypothetical protein IH596_10210 [Bacteroidales bacterium]|nr:hypothetical protein [Bacteroidales bacterium]
MGNVIGSFKSAATKRIRASGYPEFTWLPRYHDRIIRDHVQLTMIEQYIRDNTRRWSGTST